MTLRALFSLIVFCVAFTACEPERSRSLPDKKDGKGGNNNGGGGGGGGGSTEGREFGDGDYAIILSGTDEPSKYCWYIKETVRIWTDGSQVYRRDNAENICVEGGVECTANEPMGHTDETDTSYVRVGYNTVGYDALYGTCDHLERYWSDDDDSVQCLFHKHCYGGRKCVDYLCVCPEGVECMQQQEPMAPGGEVDAGVAGGDPNSGQPDSGQPNSGQSDSGQPNNGQPDSGQRDSGQADLGQSNPPQPDAGLPSGPPPADASTPVGPGGG